MAHDFYTKTRLYGLMALYISLAFLSLLLTYVSFRFWPYIPTANHSIIILSSALSGVISAFISGKAARKVLKSIQGNYPSPSPDYNPFLAITLSLSLTGWIIISILG